MKKIIIFIISVFVSQLVQALECPEYEQLNVKYKIKTDPNEIQNYKKNGQKLIDDSFQKRLELHSALPDLTNDCKLKLRTLFTIMRMREDYIGSLFYKTPQIPAESIDFKKAPPPISGGRPYPFHLTNQKEKFEFKNGDIMITKGISFTSSTISEVMTPKSVFSHIVFVHVDPVSNIVQTMESYIGHGVSRFSMDEALRNENVRILILRLKDQTLANAASKYMFEKIIKSEKEKSPIPYDYELNFLDNKKLSCEEIAYDSLKTASHSNVIIPENLSTVFLNDKDFLSKIGLKSGPMMIPADMETDSRFDVALDWTEFKIIRDSERKDAVMGEMFRWMNDYKYSIHESFKAKLAGLIWSTRNIPGVWHIFSKISGIPTDFKKDVPSAAITTLQNIKEIGKILLDHLTVIDEEFNKKNNRWMTSAELRSSLNDYRLSRPKNLEKYFSSIKD